MYTDNLSNTITPEDSGEAGISVTSPAISPLESSENSPESDDIPSEESGPRLVERRTGLRGQGIAPGGRIPVHSRRKSTLYDLNERDPEIPYVKTERAIRDLVCSLMERQDRMNEDILERVIDLQYRMEDIEDRVPAKKKKKTGTGPEVSG